MGKELAVKDRVEDVVAKINKLLDSTAISPKAKSVWQAVSIRLKENQLKSSCLPKISIKGNLNKASLTSIDTKNIRYKL